MEFVMFSDKKDRKAKRDFLRVIAVYVCLAAAGACIKDLRQAIKMIHLMEHSKNNSEEYGVWELLPIIK